MSTEHDNDGEFLLMEWTASQVVGGEEYSDLANDWIGTIKLVSLTDGLETKIGTISVSDIKVWKVSSEVGLGRSFLNILDAHAGESEALYHHLFDLEEENFRENLFEVIHTPINYAFADEVFNNLIHISHLRIEDEFKGKKYGLRAVEMAVRRFENSCTLCYINPIPLQHSGLGIDAPEPDLKPVSEATRSLAEHYERLGFEPYFVNNESQDWPEQFDCEKHEVVMVAEARSVGLDEKRPVLGLVLSDELGQ